MPTASSFLAAVTTLGLATSSVGLAPSPAAGALLIEGVFGGKALRIVVDAEATEADVTLGDKRHALDLESGEAHRIDADGTVHAAAELSARKASPNPEIKPWGPGPTIAGHASVYHVMRLEGEICGELLISPWMKPFVDPAVEALSILERIKGGGIAPTGLKGACADLPFSSYALVGWPLMAGSIDKPIFRTENISFDYLPRENELVSVD